MPLEEKETGPCYACVFPPVKERPDKTDEERALEGTGACSDEGVVGALCGVVGLGMVSEALRVMLGIGESCPPSSFIVDETENANSEPCPDTAIPTLHLLSPLSASPCRTIKLRTRKVTCPTCSTTSSPPLADRWRALLATGEWEGWEGDPLCSLPGAGEIAGEGTGTEGRRIKARELGAKLEERRRVRVVDVRSATEFGICRIGGEESISEFIYLLRLVPAVGFSC